MRINKDKMVKWLKMRGVEILPTTNQYELIRFNGRECGVIYKSGKVNSDFTKDAVECFLRNKKWDGAPVNTGRKSGYKREKRALLKRDGNICFLCGELLDGDISLEHLIPLSMGGKNTLSNMVLMHEKCNSLVGNKPLNEKVSIIISERVYKGHTEGILNGN